MNIKKLAQTLSSYREDYIEDDVAEANRELVSKYSYESRRKKFLETVNKEYDYAQLFQLLEGVNSEHADEYILNYFEDYGTTEEVQELFETEPLQESISESNMSYCRFQNTLGDLQDCYYNIEDVDDMSADEKSAREKLIDLCVTIAEDADYYKSLGQDDYDEEEEE